MGARRGHRAGGRGRPAGPLRGAVGGPRPGTGVPVPQGPPAGPVPPLPRHPPPRLGPAGTVTGLVSFGAFVRVAPAVVGLVPLDELAPRAVRVGDRVQVTLTAADGPTRRITLSLRPPTA
ncbi:S1 RNA-binding domain-containing protein [Kitasatospora camelliae]|uniref:S1 RNA-binding domain-containing protein n=1 Tax=Kitasatospora camelliae TaxID=3156397 RepID=A0AAU8K9M3_9ACTN